MSTEKSITNKILKYLNSLPKCKAIKIHGSQFMEAGTPDIFCVKEGKPYLFEVKQPGKLPTAIQYKRLFEWAKVGADTAIITTIEELQI